MTGGGIREGMENVLDLYFLSIAAYWVMEVGAQRYKGSRTMGGRDPSMLLIFIPFWVSLLAPLVERELVGTQASFLTVTAGGVLIILSGMVRAKGILDMAGRFSMAIEDTGELVDTGVFAHIRHPLYLGNLLIFLGCPLFMGAVWSWSVAVVGATGIWIRIRKEERFLIRTMPGYIDYMERTKAIIPGLL